VKLRIEGNSLRLRVTQKEVAQLRHGGCVESFVELAPAGPLFYRLESSLDVTAVTASFDGHVVRVAVPAAAMTEWAESDQIGIEGRPQTGVQVLIEKDFQCLHRRREQDADAYPHPLRS